MLVALGVTFYYQNVVEILKRVIKKTVEGATEAEIMRTRGQKENNSIKNIAKCEYCGKKGHSRDKCFTRYDDQNYCNYCSTKGHKFRECRKRRNKRVKLMDFSLDKAAYSSRSHVGFI